MFLLLAAMVVITVPENVTADATPDHYVSKTGSNTSPYNTVAKAASSIQSAINVAGADDTIHVAVGTYSENVIITTSDILLQGASRENTIIDAGGSSHVVEIKADDVSMDKFTVQNSGGSGSGIFLRGASTNYINGCTITNINCEDDHDGIRLFYAGEDSSNYNTFQYIYSNIDSRYIDDNSIWLEKEANYNQFFDCYIFQSQDTGSDGVIRIYESSNNEFTDIEISGNDGDGFYLEYNSDGNDIISSEIQNTENGISLHGSVTNECNSNIIRGNDIDSNENSCIYINTCDGNTIDINNLGATDDSATYVIQFNSASGSTINNNVIKEADIGIVLDSDSDENLIYNNEISYCDSYGVKILSSYSNYIHHNNFIENNGAGESWDPAYIQAYDDVEPPSSVNFWDNGYPETGFDIDIHGGNYWSDWGPVGSDELSGPDQNEQGSDGIVDGFYDIESIVSDDFYPLKESVEV
jgi:parallel beta-helix repeat protein